MNHIFSVNFERRYENELEADDSAFLKAMGFYLFISRSPRDSYTGGIRPEKKTTS